MPEINLALFPPLDVVKQVELELIVQDIAERASLENASPSDPAYRVALAAAYREMMLRQDANEMCLGLMLAFAKGPQLDHIGATYYRHPDGSPVLRLAGELDDAYLARLQNSPEGLSVAGADGAYIFHALSAHSDIKDATVIGPHSAVNPTAPGFVDMVILSHVADGTPTVGLLTLVDVYLTPKRPLTDALTVKAASITNYTVTAELYLKSGPDPESVRQLANDRASIYIKEQHQLGGRIVESKLHWALTVEGVEEVKLINFNEVLCQSHQAPYCTNLAVTIEGYV